MIGETVELAPNGSALSLSLEYWDWREERGLSPTLQQQIRFERWREMLERSVGLALVDAPDEEAA